MQLQVHLAEYSALRNEALTLIKWRDSLVFISLSISGAIFSFVFSRPLNNAGTNVTALYLVAPLSSIVGGLWMVNTWRIKRIGNYISEEISKKINMLLNSSGSNITEINIMQWESSNQRIKYKWNRRIIEWFVYLMTFIVSGILAQLLLLKSYTGSLKNQILELDFPGIYIMNCIMVIFGFVGLMVYLFKGFKQRVKPSIYVSQ